MIVYRQVKVEEPATIKCDRCGHCTENTPTSFEFGEYISIDHTCGYGSIIGDGTRLQIDLCQQCIKELLLPFAQVQPVDLAT
jgi:hypothetical protein